MIRPATPADTPALLALTAATGKFKPLEIETLGEVLDGYFDDAMTQGHHCVVWEDGGAIRAYAYFAPAAMTDRTWYLYWIAVDPAFQGQKLGRKLMAHAEERIAAEAGRLLLIETSSTPAYEPTRNFYLKLGYDVVATLPDYYADGDSMVVFARRITASAGRMTPDAHP